MGQPTHALTAHVGKPQLWNFGPYTTFDKKSWGPNVYRLFIASRVLSLFFISPLIIPNTNFWKSKNFFFNISITKNKKRNEWKSLPNFKSLKYVWYRYFRVIPNKFLYKEADQIVYKNGFIKKKPSFYFAWAKVKILNVKGLNIFLLQGFPMSKKIRLSKKIIPLKKIQAKILWFNYFKNHTISLRFPLIKKKNTKSLIKQKASSAQNWF